MQLNHHAIERFRKSRKNERIGGFRMLIIEIYFMLVQTFVILGIGLYYAKKIKREKEHQDNHYLQLDISIKDEEDPHYHEWGVKHM